MMTLGLKLWSTNKHYISDALRLWEQKYYQYIELFSVPDSFDTTIGTWVDLAKNHHIPFVIHAPHFAQGMNLALKERATDNMRMAREAQQFADMLHARFIVFHPGAGGSDQEIARQLRLLNDQRIVIENKPYHASAHSTVKFDRSIPFNGSTPQSIRYIVGEAGVGFCFDAGHAICSANSQKLDPEEYIYQFMQIRPVMYHLTDGDWKGVDDQHPHLGEGTFKLAKIVAQYPSDAQVTLETYHDYQDSLSDFEKDAGYMRLLERQRAAEMCLLPARKSDARAIFDVSNDPVVRQNSINSEPLVWKQHVAWYDEKLNDPKTIFYSVKNKENNFIGYVRFERDEQNVASAMITVHLSETFRGKGLGGMVITQATRWAAETYGITLIHAYVKEQNIASIKSFKKAHYVFDDKKIINNDCYHIGKFEYESSAH